MNKQTDVDFPNNTIYSRSWQQLLRAQRQTIRNNAKAESLAGALYLVRGIMAKHVHDDCIEMGHRILD